MAQRTEKEETEFKVVPEALTHCVNNCGVSGNPSTNNMCQKCFNAATTSDASTSSAAAVFKFSGEKILPTSTRSTSFRFEAPSSPATTTVETVRRSAESARSEDSRRVVNRCSGCRRKVGLTGFRCRCGELFCSDHRYSDRHVCSYDYKATGREAIARENPVVKAAKIVRV